MNEVTLCKSIIPFENSILLLMMELPFIARNWAPTERRTLVLYQFPRRCRGLWNSTKNKGMILYSGLETKIADYVD